VDGREVSLASLRGQVVVLHFWAKWCGACQGDLEAFQDLHEKYSPEGVAVVGIAHASGPDQEVLTFAEAVGLGFPNIQATDELRDAYNAAVFPTTVLVDRSGRIRYRANARVDSRYWDELVDDLLKEEVGDAIPPLAPGS
jgi:peroxiredoxin